MARGPIFQTTDEDTSEGGVPTTGAYEHAVSLAADQQQSVEQLAAQNAARAEALNPAPPVDAAATPLRQFAGQTAGPAGEGVPAAPRILSKPEWARANFPSLAAKRELPRFILDRLDKSYADYANTTIRNHALGLETARENRQVGRERRLDTLGTLRANTEQSRTRAFEAKSAADAAREERRSAEAQARHEALMTGLDLQGKRLEASAKASEARDARETARDEAKDRPKFKDWLKGLEPDPRVPGASAPMSVLRTGGKGKVAAYAQVVDSANEVLDAMGPGDGASVIKILKRYRPKVAEVTAALQGGEINQEQFDRVIELYPAEEAAPVKADIEKEKARPNWGFYNSFRPVFGQ